MSSFYNTDSLQDDGHVHMWRDLISIIMLGGYYVYEKEKS